MYNEKVQFYVQSEGTAMGSPLPRIIANLYMEHFESVALESSQLQHKAKVEICGQHLCYMATRQGFTLYLS